MVKRMFTDPAMTGRFHIGAVNSINWARLMAQVVYYFASALQLGAPHRPVAFSVPTGNFGNVLAAWAARRMGLPVERLIVGANRNDILARWLAANDMSARPVEPSLSPSMDIQVSSTFERLLFELLGRDAAATAATMRRFRAEGRMPVPDSAWREARGLFHGFTLDDAGTLAEIRRLHETAGYLADPHTAIGTAAARALAPEDPAVPVVVAATAHPAKFPDAVERATGCRPPLPARLADQYERPERYRVLPPDLAAIEAAVRSHARRNTD
jgi:threonine synthase